MLALQTCAAVQLGCAVAVHIHQLCHGEAGQQSAEAVICTRGSLAVLVLQRDDLVEVRLCTLRCQCAEVSRACRADCYRTGERGAEHCLSDFVHRGFSFLLSGSIAFSSLYGTHLPPSTGTDAKYGALVKYFTISCPHIAVILTIK